MNHRAVIFFSFFTISISYLIATQSPNLDVKSSESFIKPNSKLMVKTKAVRAVGTSTVSNLSLPTPIDTAISKAFVTGRFLPQTHIRFQMVPADLCSKSMYLQKDVVVAFRQMKLAAASDGITLRIISGTRNFWEQQAIWERKWKANLAQFGATAKNAREILKYSSMPSSSRHHWGTDIDINNLSPGYFATGRGLKELQWLRKNAIKFGFVEVYSPRESGRITGYEPEAWHWSYSPLSTQYLSFYKQNIAYSDFKGFLGCEWAQDLRIIEDFVGGVSNK